MTQDDYILYLQKRKKMAQNRVHFMVLLSRVIMIACYISMIIVIIYLKNITSIIYNISFIIIFYFIIKLIIEWLIKKKKKMIRNIGNKMLSKYKLKV